MQRVDEGLHSQFIELWITHRIEGGTTPEAAQRLALDGTLRNALQRNDICAFIAFTDDRPAGYVVLADSTRSLLVDSPCVSIDMLFVHPDFRRQGIGRSLLSSASRYADRQGCEHLASRGSRRRPRGQPLLRASRLRPRDGASRGVVRDAPAQAGGGAATPAGVARPAAASPRPAGRGAGAPARPEDRRLSTGPRLLVRQAPGAASRSRQVILEVQRRLPSSSVTTTS